MYEINEKKSKFNFVSYERGLSAFLGELLVFLGELLFYFSLDQS